LDAHKICGLFLYVILEFIVRDYLSPIFYYFYLNLKQLTVRKILNSTLILLLAFSTNISIAQNGVQDVIDDMLIVADNFAAPGAEGAALQASAGWFSSASTLGKWQVELSVHGNALFVPNSKLNKSVRDESQFKVLRFQGNSNQLLPTVYGGDTDVIYEGSFAGRSFTFDALDGLDKKVVLHAFPQVTVGLPFKTEIALRYLPEVFINDVGISTYGVGLKHNISQYFQKRFNAEDFQLAIAATYSNFQANYKFLPLNIQIANLNRIDVNADLYNVQALGSKLYDTFEVVGGVGYTNSSFDYAFGGTGGSLGALNDALTGIGKNEGKFKGTIGFNFYANKLKVSTLFTASNLFNANVGLHYRFN